ncbi:MAG: Hsp20/alpha crystallin family protein [Candidatus Lokiarchaeota archaeon]
MSKDKIDVKKKEGKEPKKAEDEKSRELSVRRGNPFSLFQEIDKMFDDFWREDSMWPIRRRKPIKWDEIPYFRTPLTNITETDKSFDISAEIPGLDKGDIEITLQEGTLEIKGEQKQEKEEKKEGYVRREYSSASYYRAFELPDNIEKDDIEANLEKGILKISIPKKKPEPKKKIDIK